MSLGKAAVGGPGVKPEDVKERLVENVLRGALRPNAARQILIGAGAWPAAECEPQRALK